MTNRRPLLLLDIDGTLSGYGPVADAPTLPYGSFRLPYRSEVLQALTDLAETGCEIVWLTTWPDDLALDLGNRFELPPFGVPPIRVDGPAKRQTWWHGWKTRTALHLVRERRPTRWAWADDAIPTTVARRVRAGHPEALVLAPDPQTGLTHRQMTRISAWLAGSRA